MGDVIRKYKRIEINTELLDKNTGELTQVKNGTLYKSVFTNEVVINYKNYVYLDTDKLTILISRGIKQVDLALLVTLSANLQHRYCACLKNQELPNTTKSIAQLIGETSQAVRIKINRLLKLGIIVNAKSVGNPSWG